MAPPPSECCHPAPPRPAPSCSATSGADQGIHNYVLHYLGARGELPFKFRVADNQASPVHTAQYGWPVTINRFGALRRAAGSRLPVPPIVHQYDRLWPVKQLAQGLYPVLGSELTYAKEMYAADPAMVLPGCQPPPDQALPQQ